LSDNGPFLNKFNRLITMVNTLCKLGFMQYNIIGIAIFKEEPSEMLKDKLVMRGFDLIKLPCNPYV